MARKDRRERRSNDGTSRLKICVDKYLPIKELVDAGRRARRERRANRPLGAAAPSSLSPRLRMAIETKKMWANGRTLKVAFLGGELSVQRKVEHFARLWEQHANIRLDFGPHSDAELRVDFDQVDGGSWSYLGMDALSIKKPEATMNFGWLTPGTSDREYERVVVHEFGHALGAIHEHQNPNGNIPWDKAKVYAYYARQGWDEDDVDSNIFEKYSHTQVNATEFDPRSIMLYAVPEELTIGNFEIGWNTTLSDQDKRFIARQYPKAVAPATLSVDGPAVIAAISLAGEEDVFDFEIEKKGRYVVETTGKTDVVLALYGPDDPNEWIAQDDDSGIGRNARLTLSLAKGHYVAAVQHYSKQQTGMYGIRVRSDA